DALEQHACLPVRVDLVELAVAETSDHEAAVGPVAEAVRVGDTAAHNLRLAVAMNPGHAAARVGCPYSLPVYPDAFRSLESVPVWGEVGCGEPECRHQHVILRESQRFVYPTSARA